jgi:hypothetical protein
MKISWRPGHADLFTLPVSVWLLKRFVRRIGPATELSSFHG